MDETNNSFINFIIKLWSFIKQLLIVFLYFIIVVSLQVIFRKAILNSNFWIANISNIFVELLVLIMFIFIFRKTIVPDFYDFKKNYKKYIKKSFIYWFIGLIIMVVSNLIISNYIGTASNEEANQLVLKLLPIYSSIVMVAIAPITEELMTRVLLKDVFKNSLIYVLFSGLIFGLLHVLTASSISEILFVIPYGVLGCSFAYMYSKTNNIWTSIIFHSFHNIIALILFFSGV